MRSHRQVLGQHAILLSPEIRRTITRYARRRVALMCWAGIAVSSNLARELVDDVYADTMLGVLPLAPDLDLLDHLRNALRRRTWLAIRRARRVPVISLHETPERVLVESGQEERGAIVATLASVVYRELWPVVSRDVDARAIMMSWTKGYTDKSDALEFTGLSRSAYACALRRLRGMIRGVSPGVREAALELLRH